MEKIEAELPEVWETANIAALPGQGVTATINGKTYWVGNEKSVQSVAIPDNIQQDIERLKHDGFGFLKR